MSLTDIDSQATNLIEKASSKIVEGFDEKHHRLVTAILTEEGNVYYGINLQLDKIRRASACSDSGAISNVVLNKEHPKLLVAVRKPPLQNLTKILKSLIRAVCAEKCLQTTILI